MLYGSLYFNFSNFSLTRCALLAPNISLQLCCGQSILYHWIFAVVINCYHRALGWHSLGALWCLEYWLNIFSSSWSSYLQQQQLFLASFYPNWKKNIIIIENIRNWPFDNILLTIFHVVTFQSFLCSKIWA